MPHQLFALPRHMPGLFLRFARHPDHRQLPRVTLHVARQTLTQRRGIARITLHSRAFFIEFAWRNHVALSSGRFQLSIETKAKPARFVDYMHRVTPAQQRLYPGHKLLGREPPRRFGQQLIVLRYRNVKPRVDIQTNLDDRAGKFYFTNGILE